jgi:hypothetical protein
MNENDQEAMELSVENIGESENNDAETVIPDDINENLQEDDEPWEACPRCKSSRVGKSWTQNLYFYIIPSCLLIGYDLQYSVSFLGFYHSPIKWYYYFFLIIACGMIEMVWEKMVGVKFKCKDCGKSWNIGG